MSSLVCTKRDESIKVKALRRMSIAPAIIYGKNLDASVKIQIPYADITTLLKTTTLVSQVELNVDGEIYLTMLKKIDYTPMTIVVEHMDFQVLTKGEKIKTSAPINLLNKDLVPSSGNLEERLRAIEYEVLPKDIVDQIDVDLATLTIGSDIKVQDLAMAKDDRYHIITPLNSTIVALTVVKKEIIEEEEETVED